jgi:hypothetical protein
MNKAKGLGQGLRVEANNQAPTFSRAIEAKGYL